MENLYIKVIEEHISDMESSVILAKEHVRKLVNHWQNQKLTTQGSSRLRTFIEKRIIASKVLRLEKCELSFITCGENTYLKLMSYEDLEYMFRIEAEYWVIRRKLPVSMTKTLDDYFKIFLGTLSCCAHFDNFREAEKWLQETYIPVERISQSDSPFREEDNLVAIFKVK